MRFNFGRVTWTGSEPPRGSGWVRSLSEPRALDFVPTRYREVVLTLSKSHARVAGARIESY